MNLPKRDQRNVSQKALLALRYRDEISVKGRPKENSDLG
jgi:hypothetical protein